MKLKGLDELIKYAGGKRMLIPYRVIALWMSKLPKIPSYLSRLGLMRNLESIPAPSDNDRILLGKLDLSPFKKVPDIESFEIRISNYDVLFAACGIRKRWSPSLSFKPGRNRSINRYLLNQKLRLVKLIESGQYEAYFKVSDFLVKRSRCFFISQLSHSYKNGHRDKAGRGVKKLYANYKYLALNNSYQLDYKRVFIPKSETKKRPLGVPQPEGIMYLGVGNRFMMLYIMTRNMIQNGQHAYLPGKGTKSAGVDIFTYVKDCKYIYSFDLEAFFPSIDHNFLYRTMLKKDFPKWICDWVYDLNANIPKGLYFTQSEGTEIEQVSEPYDKLDLARQSITKKLPSERVTENEGYDAYHGTHKIFSVDAFEGNRDFIDDPYGELRYRKPGDGSVQATRGVPQGGPISPLLSLLCLEELFNHSEFDTLMYADDGLFYSNNPNCVEKIESLVKNRAYMECGTRFAEKKSYGVRKKEGLKPLEFLGLSYYGKAKTLYANTRKGSKLVFDKLELLDLLRHREIVTTGTSVGKPSAPSFETMIKLGVGGLIQSRLYSGKGNTDFEQDFDYTFVKGSGAFRTYNKHGAKKLNVFNSTSFASKGLLYALKHIKAKAPVVETPPLQEVQIVSDLMRSIVESAKGQPEDFGGEEGTGTIPPIEEGKEGAAWINPEFLHLFHPGVEEALAKTGREVEEIKEEEEPKPEEEEGYTFDIEEELKDFDEGIEILISSSKRLGVQGRDIRTELKMRRMMFEAHSQNFMDREVLRERLKEIDKRHNKIIEENDKAEEREGNRGKE